MRQLIVFCEGDTEGGFCKQVLQPHLFPEGSGRLHTLAVGEKNHRHVYGINTYGRLRKSILNELRRNRQDVCYFTTLIDLYGIPKCFPGFTENQRNSADPTAFVRALEAAFERDIDDYKFIPHLQLHEFETMLFADPEQFAPSFENCDEAIEKLKSIAQSFRSIEHINDGRDSAPSKRIIKLIPQYKGRKTSAGPDIAERIGIPTIRSLCPHFDAWLGRLGSLD